MADILTRFGVTYAEVELPQTLTDGTGDSLANDIALSDEAQTLTLEVTAEQYTKLLSAALNGANRHYPDEYIAVIYPLIKAAKVSDTFCNAIAECIENPESGTYDALQDFLLSQIQNNQDVINALSGVGNTDGTLVAGITSPIVADCDLDNLFGFCRQVVQFMNLEVEQFFEVLEVITNNVEFSAFVGDEAPALGTIASFVSYLQNTLVESYLANYDVDYENDLACELFCFARSQPDCTLNWFNITDIMGNRVGEDIESLGLSSLLTYILSGGWSGDEFCDASILVFAFLMQIGADWAGISFPKIQQIMQTFLNDPDEDWSLLCPCGWSYTENFASDLGVFDLHDYGASWTPTTRGQWGVGGFVIDTYHEYIPNGNTRRGTSIEITFTGSTNLTKVRLNYNALIAGGTPISRVHVYNGASEVYLKEWNTENTGDGEAEIDCTMDVTATKIWIDLVCGLASDSEIPGGSNNIPFVIMQGTGSLPPPLA